MDELSRAWIAYLMAERKPEHTIKGRARVLRSVGNAGTATREEIEAWWATRRDKAASTRSNDLAHLRQFYKWCQRWEHRAEDPTLRLDAPRVDKGLPRPMSRADLRTCLDNLPDPLRRATALGAYGGLRVSEAAALSWPDVDVETRRARVKGKGGKERMVALGTLLIDHLLPEVPGQNVVTGGEPLSANALERRINRAIRAQGIDATFHQLRHRYGTLAYQATKDLVAVGRQMGHASPITTLVYAAASDDTADVIAEAVTQ